MKSTLAGSPSVFLLELVTAGYFGDQIGSSFRAEGRAMFDAVRDDLQRLPGVRVETPAIPHGGDDIRERLLDAARSHTADAALIIAPEFDGLLETFCAAATRSGCRSLNSDAAALRLCGDKWKLFRHLSSRGIATVPSRLWPLAETPAEFPCVVKPRDGAGSWLVRAVADAPSWRTIAAEFATAGRTEFLCQPLVAGTPCSVAAIAAAEGRLEILPVAEQRLSDDGEFRYLGGRIPARLPADAQRAVRELVERCLAAIPGLRGYVGCDVILPRDRPLEPLLVEINPRFTTSYIGYRRLCRDNLLESIWSSRAPARSLSWRPGGATFDPHGDCTMTDADS